MIMVASHHRNLATTGLFAALALASAATFGAALERNTTIRQSSFRPVLIQAGGQTESNLGIDYDLSYRKTRLFAPPEFPSDTVPDGQAQQNIGELDLTLNVRGTLTASKNKTPNKLIDFTGTTNYALSTTPAWYYAGAAIQYESDQSFDNRQWAYGLTGAVALDDILQNGDYANFLIRLARVTPINDPARKSATGKLDAFQRINVEIDYTFNTGHAQVKSINFNYRHYQELASSTPVRQAGLDRNRLGTVRFNLAGGFFAQFSRGSLPFDQRSERAVKIGWSAQLK